ncbi:MAG: hypothetical protein KF727_05815 [Microbacteriaceae bacterium]|nr:hypothetical protein [Microbacteriaceae bacterium]
MYASDEEALAAAEEAYQRYLDVSNAVGAGGWVDTDGLSEVLRGEALDESLDATADLHDKGYRQIGDSTFDSAVLQQYAAGTPGTVSITTYLCLDVSAVDVVDSEGQSIVTEGRADRQSLEVGFDDLDGVLKVNRSEAWSGASFC